MRRFHISNIGKPPIHLELAVFGGLVLRLATFLFAIVMAYSSDVAATVRSRDWCLGRISFCCRARHLHAVELVALRRVAPCRAAHRSSGAAHSVRSTRTGLSQRDKHHLQELELRPGTLDVVR